MTLFTDTLDAGRRAYLGIVRGTLKKASDDPMLQELEIEHLFSDGAQKVEHWLGFGFSQVPLPPNSKSSGSGSASGSGQSGGSNEQEESAEVLLAFLNGNPSHPVVIGTADRRHRPKNMQPGESVQHDDQGQAMHLKRDALVVESPKKVVFRHYSQESDGQSQGKSSKGGRDMSKAVTATADVEVSEKKIVLKVGGTSITITDGKIVLDAGAIHLGGEGGELVHRKGDVDSGGDTAVGAATKVYAV